MACHTPGPRLSDGCGGGRSQVRKQEQRLRGARGGGGVPRGSDQTRPAAVPGCAGCLGAGQSPQERKGRPWEAGARGGSRCFPGMSREAAVPRAGPGVRTRVDREAASGSLGLAFQSPASPDALLGAWRRRRRGPLFPFCPGRTSHKSRCEHPRGLAWFRGCPQDTQHVDLPAARESFGPLP